MEVMRNSFLKQLVVFGEIIYFICVGRVLTDLIATCILDEYLD